MSIKVTDTEYHVLFIPLLSLAMSTSAQREPSLSSTTYMSEYRWMLDNMGCYESKNPLDVTYKEFGENSTFFAFDLSPELCNLYHQHGNQSGVFDFDVSFKTPLTNNVTAIIYGSFHEVVMIDKNRNVTVVE